MNHAIVSQQKIYQCSATDIRGGGGIETYIASLVNSEILGVSNHHINSFQNLDQGQCKLLHLHDPEFLAELRGECPAIFTLHNHCSYCPSGTKYLANRQQKCDRNMHLLGCTWGHLVDGCGSRRPEKIWQNWQSSYDFLSNAKKINIPIIANSNYVRKQIINNGLSPHRVITLHCGVKQPKYPTTSLTKEIHQNQRILFVGRIVPDKGIEWLLKALAKTNPNIHLDIAGEGWIKSKMEKLAKKIGLNERITWHGWCNKDKLETLYQQCLAVVFPSLWPEPAGLVTLEAYAHYRPIIASSIGGIPEYVQNSKTGILIPPNHIQNLADAINELATNYHKSRLMGEEGQQWFQQEFSLDLHIHKLEKIYSQTIAEFKHP
ncbi:glycosyltransferase family 4 protein [Dolichospermum planctonicum UHCC 0167]|jgi:glycosyltransferase involved in cell wall biosynthesis|uniref:glycosyltransferase family 4 protein n=1 Tax=Dolichospermum planctonicum TaxID=136072 RepID=UPI0014433D94|nr:glycosyltransferase family 4 protein [Dolichospermum planctonicum]MCW9682328.1 glycosyltransferase family 4 protein [Dolichospermum planctonicum UHCC 0167]